MAKYILGIDFGHGETSAAFCNCDNINDITDAKIKSGKGKKGTLIKSAICKTEKGWVFSPKTEHIKQCITHYSGTGTNPSQSNALPFHSYLKGPLKERADGKPCNVLSSQEKAEFCEFIKLVYEKIKDNYKDKPENDLALYVACPSGWDNGQVAEYKRFLIDDCHLPCEDVVRESDAAYVSSRDKIQHKGDRQPGVLVIDYGSSTIDFTWYGGSLPIHNGYDLGAQHVERIILRYMLKKDEDCQAAFKNALEQYNKGCTENNKMGDSKLEEILLYLIRENKESLYDNVNDGDIDFAAINEIDLGMVLPRVSVSFGNAGKYNATFVRMLLESNDDTLVERHPKTNVILSDYRDYIGQVRKAFNAFKSYIDPVTNASVGSIDYVILTGGASIMDFVVEIVQQEYGVDRDAETLICDDDCNFAISRGIAKFGSYKYLSEPIIEKIDQTLKEEWGISPNETDAVENKRLKETFAKKFKEEADALIHQLYQGTPIHNEEGESTENVRHDGGVLGLLEDYTSQQNTSIKLEEGKELNEKFKTIIDGLSSNDPCKKYWDFVKSAIDNDTNITGRSSLHALFSRVMEFVDTKNGTKSAAAISDMLNNRLAQKFAQQLQGLFDEYTKVYFPNYQQGQSAVPISAKFNIGVNITDDEILRLLKMLIEKSYKKIDENPASFIGVKQPVSKDTLNNDRSINNSLGVNGREHFTILKDCLEDFVQSIKPNFNNIATEAEKAQKEIAKAYVSLRELCEKSIYSLNSSLFDQNTQAAT